MDNFNLHLHNFLIDFFCKDEIISKYKNKKSITEIRNELAYKITEAEINKVIDDYQNDNYEFIKVEDEFGKVSFVKSKK